MAALSDTPTPAILTSATSEDGVSIKLEQGVFHENNYGSGVGVYHNNAERRGNLNMKYDSNHHPPTSTAIENGSNNITGNSSNIFQSSVEIKNEPPVDIDDYYEEPDQDEEGEENTSFNSSPVTMVNNGTGSPSPPQIRLTPTSKLIASPQIVAAATTAAVAASPNQKRRYVCFYENCTKSYGKSSHLRSHLTWHTGIKPFVCQEPGCGKGFTRSDELNRHTRTHTGEKPFECVQCSKKFSRSDHLTKHVATHSKQLAAGLKLEKKRMTLEKNQIAIAAAKTAASPPETSVTTVPPSVVSLPTAVKVEDNKVFTQGIHFMAGFMENMPQNPETVLTDYKEDVTTRETIKIKMEKPGSSSEEYQVVVPQKQEHHTTSPIKQEIHTAEREIPTATNIKPEPIDEPMLCVKAEVMQEENEPDDDAIMPEANAPPLPFNTSIVTTTLLPSYALASTKTSSYVPESTSSSPSAASSSLPFVMTSVNSITDSVYDPSRPFPCSQCTKCFKRQDDLNRHMRTHTGEKPFACNECEKRFMRSDHLKKHMNTHTRVR